MTNTPEGQKQKNDGKKKGLGWVPDYPDLRDYSLDDEDLKNQKRLKVEETTEWVENIIGILGEFIHKSDEQTDTKNISKSKIDELRNRIFGDVIFTKVKVHKILRLNSSSSIEESQNARYTPNKISYESILSQQIIELRKCLGILFLSGYLPFPKECKKSDLPDPIEVHKWMREEEYNSPTKSIVEEFQRRTNINPDGIVGLETYTTLTEYFSSSAQLLKLKECEKECNLDNNQEKYSPKSKFFSVTSIIPDKAFEEFIKILCKKAVVQIENEKQLSNQQNDDPLKEFESNFLKKLNKIEITDKNKSISISDILINLKAPEETGNKLDTPESVSLSNSIEILKNSYFIEPIISAMIKSLSPLSQWRNKTFEELIEQGFDNFENLLRSPVVKNTPPGYSNQELSEQVIHKTLDLLKEEISSFDEQTTKKDDVTVTAFLCFILKKYLDQFKVAGKNDFNILDKEEVFEITQDSQQATKQENTELFLTLNLYIPIVSNKILQKLRSSNEICESDNRGNESGDVGSQGDTQQKKGDTQQKKQKPYFFLPAVVDLSYWFSSVKDQGSLNSCTAFAAVSLLEYFANKNSKDKIEPSALFLYKAARNKMNVTGDVGSSIRETMKVLALFGVPPEEYWSYNEEKADEEPPPYCYAFAQNYKTLKYFLLDYAGISKESLLFQIKAVLAAGFPCIFGCTLYTSAYKDSNERGHIPFPDYQEDKVVGGHTLVAVGYDDLKFIKCANNQNYSKGAFLVRNSWGTEWGVDGYGWLPYDYVLAGLTAAWWCLLKSEWFNENNFGLAAIGEQPPNGRPGN